MVVSLRKMSAGHGCRCLLKTFWSAAGNATMSTPAHAPRDKPHYLGDPVVGSGVADLNLKEGGRPASPDTTVSLGPGDDRVA